MLYFAEINTSVDILTQTSHYNLASRKSILTKGKTAHFQSKVDKKLILQLALRSKPAVPKQMSRSKHHKTKSWIDERKEW